MERVNITVKRSGPYEGLIYYTKCAVSRGTMSQAEGDEIISRFQEMSVAALTRRGPRVTNFYKGD
jgi:hypothetical protein